MQTLKLPVGTTLTLLPEGWMDAFRHTTLIVVIHIISGDKVSPV